MIYEHLINEKSRPGRVGYHFPKAGIDTIPLAEAVPAVLLRKEPPGLPEVSELDVVRHYTNLSEKCFSVDNGSYPLGSCTMKYNPKVNEDAARLPGFTGLHPLQSQDTVQGILALQYDLLKKLSSLTGMSWGTLQPFAGAHGEFTGMKLFSAYFSARDEMSRTKIVIPTSSHGTNPASAHMAGFEIVEVAADERGLVSLKDLEQHMDGQLAGIMLTNPNTLGLFEEDICRIAEMVHQAGGLLYYDGANFNAVMGKIRPGDMGFDVIHLNLHKTFATPHGGGGPGAGPVFVSDRLLPFLPNPDIVCDQGVYSLEDTRELSIGRISGFYGNIGVLIRAYTYILILGDSGVQSASEHAVLFANYLRVKLSRLLEIPYDRLCKHEFVVSARAMKEQYGISAIDIAKALIDKGIHPPTMYFPLIVPEALMIEPTETESLEDLDRFVEVLKEILETARKHPQQLHDAPITTVVGRVDEVLAARKPVLHW